MPDVYSEPEEAKQFFRSLIIQGLEQVVPNDDQTIEDYLTDLLLLRLRTESASELTPLILPERSLIVAERGLSLPKPILKQTRDIHKNIGDTLLFWLGIFPEHLRRSQREGRIPILVNPVVLGKSSYKIASSLEEQVAPKNAPLFRKLSCNFEKYILALRHAKKGLMGNA